jgi:hypothetical protein
MASPRGGAAAAQARRKGRRRDERERGGALTGEAVEEPWRHTPGARRRQAKPGEATPTPQCPTPPRRRHSTRNTKGRRNAADLCNPHCRGVGGKRRHRRIPDRCEPSGAPSRGGSSATNLVAEDGRRRLEQCGDGGGDRESPERAGRLGLEQGSVYGRDWVGWTEPN